MRSTLILVIAGLCSIGFSVLNMVQGDGRLLPGWIIVGVVFLASAGVTYAFGSDDDGGSAADYS